MAIHPISSTYLDVQQARVSGALPAAGAWDATPTVMACPSFDYVTLYIKYDEDAQTAAGSVDIRIDVSPDSAGAVWHQGTAYSTGAVVAGADTVSAFQREEISYEPTGVAAEFWIFGPLHLGGTVERMRVAAQESGDVGAPGICEIEARFQ
ncbi:unnamed protein product [marine sediment metagenome]|uniref:Uncharacterized protein n=1 Tax=marine sediment metagenome TaxID=412755 RepID=X1BU27_9ZZZZ